MFFLKETDILTRAGSPAVRSCGQIASSCLRAKLSDRQETLNLRHTGSNAELCHVNTSSSMVLSLAGNGQNLKLEPRSHVDLYQTGRIKAKPEIL